MIGIGKYLFIAVVLQKHCLLPSEATEPLQKESIFKAHFGVIKANFLKQCGTLDQYEKISQILREFFESIEKLHATEVLTIVRDKQLDEKFKQFAYSAFDNKFPQSTDPITNKWLRELTENVISKINVGQIFRILFGDQIDSEGIVKTSMEKACTTVQYDVGKCQHLTSIIACLQQSFAKQEMKKLLTEAGMST